MDSLCHVRNKIRYVLSWRTISALTRVLFWYLFAELLLNSGNKHQINPLVSGETIRHSSTYIILYILDCVIMAPDCMCFHLSIDGEYHDVVWTLCFPYILFYHYSFSLISSGWFVIAVCHSISVRGLVKYLGSLPWHGQGILSWFYFCLFFRVL